MLKLVVLGSITEDIITIPNKPDQKYIGGVPVYAASVAKAMNKKIGIVSKVGTDFHLKNLNIIKELGADLDGFQIKGTSSMKFHNIYDKKGNRTQKLLSVSNKISFLDIPKTYLSSPCIHLGPVFNEINAELIMEVRKQFDFVSLDGQGFTRTTKKEKSKIILEPWLDYKEYLPKLDVLKIDDTELKGITGKSKLQDAVELAINTGLKLLVITRAHKGAIIYHEDERYDIPAFPTSVVDATGAGDTFITAFLLEYLRTNDCYYSGLVAASAASYKISTSGPFPDYCYKDFIAKIKESIIDFQEK